MIQTHRYLPFLFITTFVSSSYLESSHIECYWCNSRDFYCDKRVVDTETAIVKCPRSSQCVVFTNPKDSNYIHRGCSYGMELNVTKNGCFVNQDGSVYCFCDFNRCNAASLLDLRNAMGNSVNIQQASVLSGLQKRQSFVQQTSKSASAWVITPTKARSSNALKSRFLLITKSRQLTAMPNSSAAQLNQTSLKLSILEKWQNKKLKLRTKTTTTSSVATTESTETTTTTTMMATSSRFSPNFYKININDSFSKHLLHNLTLRSRLGLNSNDKLSILLVKRPDNSLERIKKLSHTDRVKFNEFLQRYQRLNGKSMIKRPSPKTIFRSSGSNTTTAKPKFFIKLVPFTQSTQSLFRPNFFFTTRPTTITTSRVTTTAVKSTKSRNIFKSWPFLNIKTAFETRRPPLKSQYKPVMPFIPPPAPIPSMIPVSMPAPIPVPVPVPVSRGEAFFKCPGNGLFTHPTICSQFLQCVDHGTIYERFYILYCPNNLYFNQQLGLCDHPQNVPCFNGNSNF